MDIIRSEIDDDKLVHRSQLAPCTIWEKIQKYHYKVKVDTKRYYLVSKCTYFKINTGKLICNCI